MDSTGRKFPKLLGLGARAPAGGGCASPHERRPPGVKGPTS